MRKRWITGVIWIALLLASCQSSAQPQFTPTDVPETRIPDTQVPPTRTASLALAGCTVISPRPTPGPTERSVFPPVGADDWVSGPEGAAVTFVEYSDFQ